MNHRMRKLMAIQNALHPRDNMGRLYATRKGGRRLTSVKDWMDVTHFTDNSNNKNDSKTNWNYQIEEIKTKKKNNYIDTQENKTHPNWFQF